MSSGIAPFFFPERAVHHPMLTRGGIVPAKWNSSGTRTIQLAEQTDVPGGDAEDRDDDD